MQLDFENRSGAVVIFARGRIDAVNAQEFEKQCFGIIESGSSRLIIDMSKLEYISSAGLRSILSIAKVLRKNSGDIKFCCLQGMVCEVFAISGFSAMFSIFETIEEAL